MIILDEWVVKIIRLKISAMQDLICKKPNCQGAWQSSSKIGEFPNLGENAKILRMQVWKWSKLLQSFVRWPAPSENEKKWTWKREWKWKIWKSESESDAYSLRILYVGLHKYIQPLVLCQLSVSVFAHSPGIFSNFLYLQLSFTHLRYCFLISELLFSSFFLLFIKNQLILPSWVYPCFRYKF